jgi:hypothetical protein
MIGRLILLDMWLWADQRKGLQVKEAFIQARKWLHLSH